MKLALFAGILIFLGVVILLIVPAVVIAICAFILMAIAARVRAMFGRMRAPNGALDGRKNVRVIVRE
jgi:hypothetical protein